ncbi:MAG: type II toxin-antitoxin system prevent-host-death family antitoxin [Calditrichaeota bacterium]|nr:MAG: type II toxin-antitoxin system prevent-host-death family antitoxin [Calditrichota bacterium]
MQLTKVNIRELKNRLSHYLRLAKAGHTIEVTERGRPIGRIVPLATPLEERLEAMARLGLLKMGKKGLPPRNPLTPLKKAKPVSELLIEDRDWP